MMLGPLCHGHSSTPSTERLLSKTRRRQVLRICQMWSAFIADSERHCGQSMTTSRLCKYFAGSSVKFDAKWFTSPTCRHNKEPTAVDYFFHIDASIDSIPMPVKIPVSNRGAVQNSVPLEVPLEVLLEETGIETGIVM